ncbi:hypothetical protein [Streptomyces sp. TR02-1]|uniref:hypothetical protein n=1 Tax=Streptomyces sp. TR02-1 TaxID=3385977 RepID=UPI0039A0C2B5
MEEGTFGGRNRFLTVKQLHAMLRAGGVGVGEDDAVSRAQSLGFLLAMIEYVALFDTDRLDHEEILSGYTSMLASVPQAGSEEERARMMAFAWGRLMQDRLARTSLGLQSLLAPAEEGTYSPGPAVNYAVSAAEALLSVCNPPEGEGMEDYLELLRGALEVSQRHLRESLTQVEEGLKAVRDVEEQ